MPTFLAARLVDADDDESGLVDGVGEGREDAGEVRFKPAPPEVERLEAANVGELQACEAGATLDP